MNKAQVLNYKDPPDGIGSQCVNAAILAGLTFFGSLVGLGATGLLGDPETGLVAAAISAGFVFFSSLATQRGLSRRPQT